jgi:hypothetical protein
LGAPVSILPKIGSVKCAVTHHERIKQALAVGYATLARAGRRQRPDGA